MIPSKTEGITHFSFLRLGVIRNQTESILISPAQGFPLVSSCRMCPTCWDLPILKSCRSICHREIATQSRNPRIFRTARKSRGLCSSPKSGLPLLGVFRKVKRLQCKLPRLFLRQRPASRRTNLLPVPDPPRKNEKLSPPVFLKPKIFTGTSSTQFFRGESTILSFKRS